MSTPSRRDNVINPSKPGNNGGVVMSGTRLGYSQPQAYVGCFNSPLRKTLREGFCRIRPWLYHNEPDCGAREIETSTGILRFRLPRPDLNDGMSPAGACRSGNERDEF